jgi:hypothetical protein
LCFKDPTGLFANFLLGGILGAGVQAAVEFSVNLKSSASAGEALKQTFTGKSLAKIIVSGLIGAATSGGSALATTATTVGMTSVAKVVATNVVINATTSASGGAVTSVTHDLIDGNKPDAKKAANSALISGSLSAGATLLGFGASAIVSSLKGQSSFFKTTDFTESSIIPKVTLDKPKGVSAIAGSVTQNTTDTASNAAVGIKDTIKKDTK